jgi:ApaG protein
MADSKYRIDVEPEAYFVEEQSDVAADKYVFAYRIRITNSGTEAAKLVSRHWYITDANLQTQEVRGMGVVGEHPHLKPGETYEYMSGATLATPWGSMKGSYLMEADDGTQFDADIPEFVLAAPRVLH